MKLPAFPNLEGLMRLARQDGVDVRPTLVRVLTDVYVQKRGHTREEERRFTELALWLLSSVDHATRAAVARKLSIYPETPRPVARLLAADEFDIAEPVLRSSPCLTGEDLLAIAVERGSRHAEAIAARESHGETAVPALAGPRDDSGEANPDTTEGEPEEVDMSDQPSGETAAPERPQAGDIAAEVKDVSIGQRFLDAKASERGTILAHLAEASSADAPPPPPPPLDAIARLEAAALDKRPNDFAYELQKLLRVSRSRAQDIVDDARGEPVVIAAKAIGMPRDVLLRVLLFLNPLIGESVERVFDLMEVHYQLTPQAARMLVAGWRETRFSEKRTARYQPVHWDDEAGARRASADPARRAGFALPDGRSQPARTGDGAGTERRQRST